MTTAAVRFLSLSMQERGRVVEAAVCLFLMRLAFAALPFPRALWLMRIVQGKAAVGRGAVAEAGEISRAIARATQHVPFRAVCLQQAFAALLMLRRRGLAGTVHLGLARKGLARTLAAHAWSCCGDTVVTGSATAPDFVPIATFAA